MSHLLMDSELCAAESDSLSDSDSATIVPEQPPSVRKTITSLVFPPSARASHAPEASVDGHDQNVHIQLLVDASPGCGGVAWPAGQVLSSYLVRRRSNNSLASKNIIELGSGTGLVGLVTAKLGANHVWITDQAPLLEIMRTNVVLNGLTERVSVIEYIWGSPKPESLPVPAHTDLILAADCVYFEPAFPLLVDTLSDLVANDDDDNSPEILFCYKKRRKADKRFFTLLKKRFDWKQVEDDPDYPIYAREAISLLRLTKRRSVGGALKREQGRIRI